MTQTITIIKTEHTRLAEMIAAFEAQAAAKDYFNLPEVTIDADRRSVPLDGWAGRNAQQRGK